MASIQRSNSDVPARPPLMRRVGAGVVLFGAVALGLYLAIHVIIGLVLTVFWVAVAIAVVAAVFWALKTIVW